MAVAAQLVFFVCVCFIFCTSNVVLGLDHLGSRLFLDHFISAYGENGSIPYKGIERLYENLGLGTSLPGLHKEVHKHGSLPKGPSSPNDTQGEAEHKLDGLAVAHSVVAEPPSLSASHCLLPQDLFTYFVGSGINGSISPDTFLQLCPAILYQMDEPMCSYKEISKQTVETSTSSCSNWASALGMVVVISVVGMLCVYLIPLLQKTIFSKLIGFLVPMAAATLLGDAFLHLIPHALSDHHGEGHDHNSLIWKTGFVFLTVIICFTFEGILKINKYHKNRKIQQEQDHYVTVDIKNCEKEMVIMNQKSQDHGHSHSFSNTVPMILIGDLLHNLMDGLAVGVAFAGGKAAGLATSLAILVHELPHELGDSAVLLEAGMPISRVMYFNVVMSVMSLLGAIVGLLMGNLDAAIPWIYCATAGSFIYIALANLVPEINRELHNWQLLLLKLVGFLVGGSLMCCIALFEHDIQDLVQDS